MKNTIEKNKKAVYTPPFRPVYIIGPNQADQLPEHVIPCFRLTTASSDNFRYYFPDIRTREGRFMIALDENDNADQVLQVLMHCVFCDNYLFAGNSPVFLFYNNQPGSDRGAAFRRLIRHRLSQQGFHDIVEWGVQSDRVDSRENDSRENDFREDDSRENDFRENDSRENDSRENDSRENDSCGDELSGPEIISANTELDSPWILDHILQDFKTLSNYLVFDFNSPREAVSYEKHIALACESYLQKEPLLSEGLREFIAQQKENEKLLAENRKLKQQQASDQKTIDVIRTKYKDDYENLFKWYHNEYEILPMWYKKIGQLIKVIMGKRSFKSLFRDDVKKYKN